MSRQRLAVLRQRIADELERLRADREADRAAGDAQGGSLVGGQAAVAGRFGMAERRRKLAERRAERNLLGRGDEGVGSRPAAGQREA